MTTPAWISGASSVSSLIRYKYAPGGTRRRWSSIPSHIAPVLPVPFRLPGKPRREKLKISKGSAFNACRVEGAPPCNFPGN